MSNNQHPDSGLGQMLQLVNDICQRDEGRKQRNKLVTDVLGQLSNYNKSERKRLLEAVAEHVPAHELSEAFVRQAASVGAALYSASSFRECLTRATRKRQLSAFRNELELNSKAKGYRFAKALGVKHPKPLTKPTPIEELVLQDNSVLKPTNGSSSHGLFVLAGGTITEVKSGKVVNGEAQLRDKVNELLKKRIIKKDRWILEQYIGDGEGKQSLPARDLKFYCFYGKLGFVLEVDRQKGGHYCEWMPDMSAAETGRYQGQTFQGKGFSSEQAEQALAMSSEIPAPFMRIDFLSSAQDFMFGEFTPRPGQYNAFNASFDRYLGELYLEAESRLQQDLINGKAFTAFRQVVNK